MGDRVVVVVGLMGLEDHADSASGIQRGGDY